jgi:hypothetical protein
VLIEPRFNVSVLCRDQQGETIVKQQSLALTGDIAFDQLAIEPLTLREIVQNCSELPCQVKIAEFTYVEERLIDETLLHRLSSYQATDDGPSEWVIRLRRRREALSSYLGTNLVCVLIRLPGVQYTIEVDPVLQNVVHWEWQVA